jgi:hypothetical protein
VGNILAGIALAVSLAVAVREWRSDHRRRELEEAQSDLQRRLAQIEEARRAEELDRSQAAMVTAAVERRQKHTKTQPCLVLRNIGLATARDLSFDPSFLVAGRVIGAEDLPIEHLPPGGEYVLPLVLADQTPLSLSLTVHWKDDSGTREQQFTLSRAL